MIGGIIILCTVASLAFETARILLLSQWMLYSKTAIVSTYPEIASSVLGKSWYYVVSGGTAISCLGGCVGYLIFLGELSAQLINVSFKFAVILLMIPLILLSWIRQFKELTFFTVLGVVAACVAIVSIIFDGIAQDEGFDIVAFRPKTTMNFFGPCTFLYTIHYCVLSMGTEALRDADSKSKAYTSISASSVSSSFSFKNSKSPSSSSSLMGQLTVTNTTSSFTKPLAIAYIISTTCIAILGAFGYLFFSTAPFPLTLDGKIVPGCENHVCQNVIINLGPGPTKTLVSLALVIAISLGYIMVLAPARENIETAIVNKFSGGCFQSTEILRNIVRATVVLSTAIVAINAPYFGSILGLVGGLTDALQSFVLPPIIYLKLSGNNLSSLRSSFYKAIVIWGLCTITFTIIKMSVMIVTYLSYLQ